MTIESPFMERQFRSHPRNPNRVLHPDRLRRAQSLARALPKSCLQREDQVQTGVDVTTLQLIQFILGTEPHFVFLLDKGITAKIRESLPEFWDTEKPPPEFFVMDCGPKISEEMLSVVEIRLPDPSYERKRVCILSDEETIKPAFDLSYLLRGHFPWMDVFVLKFGQVA